MENKEPAVNGQGEAPPAPPPEEPPPKPEEVVTPDILDAIVKGYNENYEWKSFKAELGTKIGDNYMSIMYTVDIDIQERGGGKQETLSVMLKTMPRNVLRQEMINDAAAFVKEAKMYQQVFPAMENFQREKGLSEEEIFRAWPKCYATLINGKTDYIAMQNLRIDGYTMGNRQKGMDSEQAKLTLRSLARFHAISLAMYGGKREACMEKFPFLEEKMFKKSKDVQEPFKMWLKTMFGQESQIAKKYNLPIAEKLLASLGDDGDKFYNDLNEMLAGNYLNCVISHGDCWTNNILFQYEKGGKLKQMKFVDFQITRCARASFDIGYFMHSSLPVNALNNQEQEYLRVYFDEFTSFLQRLGVDPCKHDLTFDKFLDEYTDCKYYGVIMGLMLTPIVSADADSVPDMENFKEEDFNENGASDFLGQLMSSESEKKICNLGEKHLSRCPQVAHLLKT